MLLAALLAVYVVSCSQEQKGPPKPKARPTAKEDGSQKKESKIDIQNAMAVIETDKGSIEVEFFATDAPKTVANFLKNARLEYYNHGKFHRVEPGKLIQAGARFAIDKTIPIETSAHQPVKGVIAMAKAEGATVADAAQFFICLDTLELDSDYTLFGKVTKGLDVIDSIAPGDQIVTVTIREKG
jgi:cyclophilin family peptidyl-prolyl cis-trans isomerase